MRMKSRPAFRPLRAEQVRGFTPAGALRRTRLLNPADAARPDRGRWRGRRGSTPSASPRPDAIPEAAARLKAAIAAGHHGTMAWLADTADRRGSPAALWPEVRSVIMLGMNYGPDGDPLATLADRQAATISVYARNRDYHDLIKGALKRIASQFAARAGARREGLRRHRAGDGEAACRSRRARLAGQAHQPRQPRARLLALPRRDLHRRRASAGRARGGPLRLLPRLPRHLPDRRLPGALPARCAALHLLPDHRA